MEPTNHFPDARLMDRYLSSHCTGGERKHIEQWLDSTPDERHKIESLQAALQRQKGAVPPYTREARIAAIVDYSVRSGRRDRINGTQPQHTNRRVRLYPNRALTAIAAACAIIVISVFGWNHASKGDDARSTTLTTYTTSKGERSVITLPDGSSIFLNVDSKIEVPQNYSAGNRSLKLTGEALFRVQSSSGSPFTVAAGNSITRVLGTTFAIRKYPTDSTVTVTVRDGKVSVNSLPVSADQQIVVMPKGRNLVTTASAGNLTFENAVMTIPPGTLLEAISDLERWYNVEITLGDAEVAMLRLAGQFVAGSVSDLSEILGKTFNLRVERMGSTLTLYSDK